MEKTIKVLVKKEDARYSSETVEYAGNKFKIVSENDNAYSHLRIYIYTNNGDIANVANEFDIPCYKRVNYVWDAEERLAGNKANIAAAEKYIKKVW